MKTRFTKVLTMTLIMVSVLALFAQSAFAVTEGLSQKLVDEIEKTNEYIFRAVEKAQEKAEKEALKGNMSDEEFEVFLDKLIEKLVEKTEKKADKLIHEAAKEGHVFEKEYIEVEIGGRIVEIDPFYAH